LRRTLGSFAGLIAGYAVAPLFALVSFLRQARTFHPRGPCFHASVQKDDAAPAELGPLAERLLGQALVRFSGALWKRARALPDVLGCAVRFRRHDTDDASAEADDQDLLFATIRRPYTMLFSPFTTRVDDYLANDYFAVSPFDVGLSRPVYFRLTPQGAVPAAGETRDQRLITRVERAGARLRLELAASPFGPWTPLLSIALQRLSHVDGEALRFRPFRQGRGLHPRGFIHALRLGVYVLSQRARPRLGSGPATG
jgi:hypothetical protein